MENANGVIKKLTSAERSYYTAAEVREMMGVSRDTAYRMIRSLETIRDRYSDVKIMAITHDDAMKARFGQAVTVIKTDDGSKVIY